MLYCALQKSKIECSNTWRIRKSACTERRQIKVIWTNFYLMFLFIWRLFLLFDVIRLKKTTPNIDSSVFPQGLTPNTCIFLPLFWGKHLPFYSFVLYTFVILVLWCLSFLSMFLIFPIFNLKVHIFLKLILYEFF